jgi:hypothetical protein
VASDAGDFPVGARYMLSVAIVLFLFGFILSATIPGLLSAKRITKDYIWLKGVHPDYLAELPEWPQGDAVD